jgi:hypothetical protein
MEMLLMFLVELMMGAILTTILDTYAERKQRPMPVLTVVTLGT